MPGCTSILISSPILQKTWLFISAVSSAAILLHPVSAHSRLKPFQQFVNITLPGLSNIAVFVSLNIVVSAFQLIIQPMMMTAGGPQNATMTIVYEIYQTGFKYNQMGYGSAMALVFTIIVLTITLIQNKITSRLNTD